MADQRRAALSRLSVCHQREPGGALPGPETDSPHDPHPRHRRKMDRHDRE